MRHPAFGSLFATALLLAGPAHALPDCVTPVRGEGVVVRVDAQGALILKSGAVVMSESVLPSRGAVAALVLGKTVSLAVTPPERDRHGRLRAQIFAGDVWLQERLLREGLARAYIQPAHPECAEELLIVEEEARKARRGLWALPINAIRKPEGLAGDVGSFQIVEGKVLEVAVKSGRGFLNFGPDWKTDFTVTISPEDMKTFRKRKVKIRKLAGKEVRVRGFIGEYRGPQIELAAPENLQVMK